MSDRKTTELTGIYEVPIDPMDAEQCEACQ